MLVVSLSGTVLPKQSAHSINLQALAQHSMLCLMVVAQLLLFIDTAKAQFDRSHREVPSEPRRLFIGASFDRNITPASIKTFGKGTITCGYFTEGGGNALSASLGLRLPQALFGLTISPFIEYRDLSSQFTLTPPDDIHIADLSGNPELVTRERLYRGTASGLYFGATLDLFQWQGISLGMTPSLGIPLQARYTEIEQITSGNVDYVYEGGQSSTLPVREGDLSRNGVLADVGFGITTSYRLKNGLILSPSIRAVLPIISLGSEDEHTWSVYKMSAGLSIGFDLEEDLRYIERQPLPPLPPPQEPRANLDPVAVAEPVQKRSLLSATITAVGLNDDGTTVAEPTLTVERLQVTEAIPTLNYVFFNSGSARLDGRYRQLVAAETSTFDERSLFAASAERVHYEILNVIGARMQKDKSATIALVGTRSPNADAAMSDIGKQRAESVADYLTAAWEIERSRIRIQPRNLPENPSDDQTPHGQEENQRVEIIPSKPSIIAPVWANRIERVATPPRIFFEPNIISEADVAEARIVIRQNDHVLLEFDAMSDGSVGERLWRLSENTMPGDHDSIIYDLVVRDVEGNEARASGSIKLHHIRREISGYRTDSTAADRKVEKYSLILFDYSSSSLAKNQADTIINYVARSVQPGSRLTITGHTDKTGNEAFNEQLAGERAKEAAELLMKRLNTLRKKKPEMSVESHGSRDILFDNSKPEGRFLSRTVRVTVEEVKP